MSRALDCCCTTTQGLQRWQLRRAASACCAVAGGTRKNLFLQVGILQVVLKSGALEDTSTSTTALRAAANFAVGVLLDRG